MENILSHLPKITTKKKKRIGRGLGSGKGSKSTRGTTRHQKARESIPLHFEGGQGKIIKKFPLLRGKGRHKPLKKKNLLLDLQKLNIFEDGETVTIEQLIKKGLVSSKAKRLGVKVLFFGKIDKKLTVKLPVSKKVKEAIEKAGGKVV